MADRVVRIELVDCPTVEQAQSLTAHSQVLWSGPFRGFWVVVVDLPGCADDLQARRAAADVVLGAVPEWATRRPPVAVSVFETFDDLSEDDVEALVELRKR